MLEIIDCEQGSITWFEARRGLATASEFSSVLAKGKGNEESKTRKSYMRKLAAEIITGELGESYSNVAMERGKVMEAEALRVHAFIYDVEPQLVGFCRNGMKGCSPDALIDANGGVEIKTQRGDLLIETLDAARADPKWIPPEHIAQVQGNIWITEREWFDLVVYWPKMATFIRRVYRDDAYIKALAAAVDQFNDELAAMVERVRGYAEAS